MKPEQKLLKQKVFALYWGQRILMTPVSDGIVRSRIVGSIEDYYEKSYLLVTPLSQITDEDAMELGYIDSEYFNDFFERVNDLHSNEVDWLRGKGYAHRAFGQSVEELIEQGIFKLK